MSSSAEFERDGIEWIQSMGSAIAVAPRKTKRVVGQGCNNVKKEWKLRWTGYAHIPHLPRAITYDVDEEAKTFIVGVVGPKAHLLQWELGSFIELGTRTSGPIPGGFPALDTEIPKFESAMGDLGIDLLMVLGGRSFLR